MNIKKILPLLLFMSLASLEALSLEYISNGSSHKEKLSRPYLEKPNSFEVGLSYRTQDTSVQGKSDRLWEQEKIVNDHINSLYGGFEHLAKYTKVNVFFDINLSVDFGQSNVESYAPWGRVYKADMKLSGFSLGIHSGPVFEVTEKVYLRSYLGFEGGQLDRSASKVNFASQGGGQALEHQYSFHLKSNDIRGLVGLGLNYARIDKFQFGGDINYFTGTRTYEESVNEHIFGEEKINMSGSRLSLFGLYEVNDKVGLKVSPFVELLSKNSQQTNYSQHITVKDKSKMKSVDAGAMMSAVWKFE